MEQIVDAVPPVPLLDDPVPQMLEQLPDVLQFFDTLTTVPVQVIEVPKIFPDDVPVRTSSRDTQLAEQLVEVPTIISYSWLQLGLEQNVDIPVPVVEAETLVFEVFSLNGVQRRCMFLRNAFLSELWSRSLNSPLVGAFKIFAQDRVHPFRTFQLVFMKLWMSLVKGFFALFSQKKVRSWVRNRGRGCPPVSAHPRRLLSTVFVSGNGS